MPEDFAGAVFLTFRDLKERGVPFSRVHIRRLAARGQFPQPRQLSARRVAWIASEVAAWIASRPVVKPKAIPKPKPVKPARPRLAKT
jgi:prophage regulatory protein